MNPRLLYLIRHEDAESEGLHTPDPHRALTSKGRIRLRKTAEMLKSHVDHLHLVYTSPLVRAVQTAEILAGAFHFDGPIWARAAIAEPSLERILQLVDDTVASFRSIALIGHEPMLSDLAAHLLELPEYPRPFKKGSVLALDYQDRTQAARFRWLILAQGPEFLNRL